MFWRLSVPHLMGSVAALVLALPLGAPTSVPVASAAARAVVTYLPPVDAPVIDRFRPPASRYGPGNRGVDYDTEPGQLVRASAGGTVVFAGAVGLGLHVVMLHPDRLRTTYAFLAEVRARRGDRLAQGDVVGVAGERVHIGARAGAAYLDPLRLFGQRLDLRPRLVADPGVDAERPPAAGSLRRATAM